MNISPYRRRSSPYRRRSSPLEGGTIAVDQVAVDDPVIKGHIYTEDGTEVPSDLFIRNLKLATSITYNEEKVVDHVIVSSPMGVVKYKLKPLDILDGDVYLFDSWANIMNNHINEFSNLNQLTINARYSDEWDWRSREEGLCVDLPPSLTYLSVPKIHPYSVEPRRMRGVTTLVINYHLPTDDDTDDIDIDDYPEYPNVLDLKVEIDEDTLAELQENADKLENFKTIIKSKFTNLEHLTIMFDGESQFQFESRHRTTYLITKILGETMKIVVDNHEVIQEGVYIQIMNKLKEFESRHRDIVREKLVETMEIVDDNSADIQEVVYVQIMNKLKELHEANECGGLL